MRMHVRLGDSSLQEGDSRLRVARGADEDVDHLPLLVDRPEHILRYPSNFDVRFIYRPFPSGGMAMGAGGLLVE